MQARIVALLRYKRFGGVQTAVVRLTEADARSLLGLGRLRVRWVNCRIREHVEDARCFRCQGCGHVSRGCAFPGGKNAYWRCGAASHVAKECKAPPRCLIALIGAKKMSSMLRGAVLAQCLGRSSGGWQVESEVHTAEPREREGTQNLLMQTDRERRADVLLISEQHKWSETLLGTRMHQGGLGSLFAALIWASEISWRPTWGSFGWRWWGYACAAATSLPAILSRSLRPRSFSLKKS